MVDKEDEFLEIKVNHNGESKEFKVVNLPTLDELKSKIMGYLSIPDIKKYMHFSYRDKEGQNIIIKNEKDLIKYSNPSQENESYLEIDLSIDNELKKIKEFMNSAQFNSNNNNKIDSDNDYQKLSEKEKRNESEEKSNAKIKKMQIDELQNQLNDIKKRRIQKKNIEEMNNNISQNFENIIKKKKELDDLKISSLINEMQKKILNDIIPLIERNISNNLKNKNKKFDEFAAETENLINKLEININNNYNIINDIYFLQNGENILKLNNNFEEIYNTIDNIRKEINNINKIKIKNDSKELQNNNQNNKNKEHKKPNENINNANDYHIKVYNVGKHQKILLKKNSKVKSENLSLLNLEQKNASNNIVNDFNIFLEKLFYDDELKDLRNNEIQKIKDFFYELKSLEIEPLPIVEDFLDNNISIFSNDIVKKNEKEEKFRNIKFLISNLEKEYNIEKKTSLNKKEPKNYRFQRNKINKNK